MLEEDNPKGPPKEETQEEKAERQRAEVLRKSYKAYLDALRLLKKRLAKGQPSNQIRMQQALSLVLDTYGSKGELYDAWQARVRFLGDLDAEARGEGFDTGNLHQLLERLERELWRGLLPLATRQLNKAWSEGPWRDGEALRYKAGGDPSEDNFRCSKLVDFFSKDLTAFISANLSPFASNLARCEFRQMEPPFADPSLNLSKAACLNIQRGLDTMSQTICGGGGGGGGQGGGALRAGDGVEARARRGEHGVEPRARARTRRGGRGGED